MEPKVLFKLSILLKILKKFFRFLHVADYEVIRNLQIASFEFQFIKFKFVGNHESALYLIVLFLLFFLKRLFTHNGPELLLIGMLLFFYAELLKHSQVFRIHYSLYI